MMGTDLQETSSSSSFGVSILSRRRDQVHSVDSTHEATVQETELEAFQRKVFERFQHLSDATSKDLLSIPWILKLLESFICCQEEFRMIIFNNKSQISMPPMDKLTSDFFGRSVKALDVCNAIRDGIEQIRQWQKQLEIILCALDKQRNIGEGQFTRAKKALVDLTIGMLDEKESNSTLDHRNRPFGRSNMQREQRSFGHFRSLPWSVSRTWSASKQLQAIGRNLVAPRANEVISTNGLNVAVFTMNYVLLFVMWALVAAIPCHDCDLQTHFTVVRQYFWAIPILSLYERILEESKKRKQRNVFGLLKEIHEIQKCARNMNEFTDSVTFPLSEKKGNEVRQRVQDLGVVYEAIKEGLDPLEREVREVFHRIVCGRTEGLNSTLKANSHNRYKLV